MLGLRTHDLSSWTLWELEIELKLKGVKRGLSPVARPALGLQHMCKYDPYI